jgi:hypothetical protein
MQMMQQEIQFLRNKEGILKEANEMLQEKVKEQQKLYMSLLDLHSQQPTQPMTYGNRFFSI